MAGPPGAIPAPPGISIAERLPSLFFSDDGAAADYVARQIATLIRSRAAEGRKTVLGLATGATPLGIYARLVEMHRSEGLPFKDNVITFNLDEYYPIQPNAQQSYHRFMAEALWDPVGLSFGENAFIPPGNVPREQIKEAAAAYEAAIAEAGGIDLQILGIGTGGHIGFNEQGSPEDSRTRLVTLAPTTRRAAAADFFSAEHVPHEALTMGVATILSAKRVILMAFGEAKAPAAVAAIEGPRSTACPASYLQGHPCAEVVLDSGAAAQLTRIVCPWTLATGAGAFEWEESSTGAAGASSLEVKAVVWLSKRCGKPILRLAADDYLENGMGGLLAAQTTRRPNGPPFSPDTLNAAVVASLQSIVTRNPLDLLFGGQNSENSSKKIGVVVFSPHPDDDVIAMGGTLRLLCSDPRADVHVAYQTSGALAVRDRDLLQRLLFAEELNGGHSAAAGAMRDLVTSKQPGEPDPPEVQRAKALVRRAEAVSAATACGVPAQNIHFLDLPFYRTGTVLKAPLTSADSSIMEVFLAERRPSLVFAAGDLSDPHGTHRACLRCLLHALSAIKRQNIAPLPRVLLYRGAWAEWGLHEASMAVGLTPGEAKAKIEAIWAHSSQANPPPFPGADPREFWVRAETRGRATAAALAATGAVPAMEAAELFAEAMTAEEEEDSDGGGGELLRWSVLNGTVKLSAELG